MIAVVPLPRPARVWFEQAIVNLTAFYAFFKNHLWFAMTYRSFSDGGLALSPQDVLLSPNPTNPLEPSFTLSGNLTAAEAPGTSFAEQYVELDYTAVTGGCPGNRWRLSDGPDSF